MNIFEINYHEGAIVMSNANCIIIFNQDNIYNNQVTTILNSTIEQQGTNAIDVDAMDQDEYSRLQAYVDYADRVED